MSDDPISYAGAVYERAVFGGDTSDLDNADRELDAVEAAVLLARGRLRHAAHLQEQQREGGPASPGLGVAALSPTELDLFERAAALYQGLGDVRGEGEALFWLGVFHQVVRGDGDTAVPFLEKSYALASQADDKLTMSYALRHLGVAAHQAQRLEDARALLEQSTDLRREIGFLPGVAANLVGLTYIAIGQGRHDDAADFIAEARAVSGASGSQAILSTVDTAEAVLAGSAPMTPP